MKLNMRLLRNKRGFTLLEVLIVLIVLGVIAGLAIPVYTAQVEKSRKVEALQVLGAIRASEVRYFSEKGSYSATGLDFDFSAGALGAGTQTLHFTYGVASTGATFTATATRNATDGGSAANTVTITNAGVIGGTGIWAP